MNVEVKVVEGIVVRPGDRLLVTVLDVEETADRAQAMAEALRERFPDVEITMLAGATAAVIRGEENDDGR